SEAGGGVLDGGGQEPRHRTTCGPPPTKSWGGYLGLACLRLDRSVEAALQPLLDLAARGGADFLRDRLPALEQQHGRDAAHAVATGRVGILVDVELGDRHFVTELARNFLERRSDHAARTAPFSPEVDQHG